MARKYVQLKKFPLEAEATVTIGQHQIGTMSREELESYAKQSFMVMSQLTFYTAQLIEAIEEMGVEILPAAD